MAARLGCSLATFLSCCLWRLVVLSGNIAGVLAVPGTCFWELPDLASYPTTTVALVALLLRHLQLSLFACPGVLVAVDFWVVAPVWARLLSFSWGCVAPPLCVGAL